MFLTLLLLTSGVAVQAQNTVAVGTTEMDYKELGNTVGLPVTMDNSDDIVAVELTVQLPQEATVNVSGCQIMASRADGHQISVARIDNENNIYKVTAFSPANKPFKGNTGQLMTLDITTSQYWADGSTYPVTVTKALLCKSNGDNVCTGCESGAVVVPASAHADIAFDVTEIVATVKKGSTGTFSLGITNNGTAGTGSVTMQMPEWMTLQGALMPIAQGETASTVIAMSPTGEANTKYKGYIGVNIENGVSRNIPYKVTVVSEEKGTVVFTVCDDYTYYEADAPKVKNATIVVKNSATGEIAAVLDSGEEGVATVTLNEGYYNYTVTAEGHEAYTNNILVYPGQTTERTVNMSINDGIKIEYKVVETEEKDGYEIVAQATFEATVPVPQVTISAPGRVKMEEVAVGESIDVQVTLTNRGLVKARDVTLQVPEIDGFRWEALNPVVFDLRPQETNFITIRYTREAESDGCSVMWVAGYSWKCGDEPKYRECNAFTSIGSNCQPRLPASCTVVTQVKDEDVTVTLKMQFDQLLTLTRQAFEGTLTIENGSEKPMDDILLKLTETMPDGTLATEREFDISYTEFTGFTGDKDSSPWTLASGETGVLKVKFIPTKYAAPDVPIDYLFGGNLTFSVNGKERRVALAEQVMTVKPSPELAIDYFLQRDVIGDDPLTQDVIEPSEEAELAVLIRNIGNGDAENLAMVMAQPEIVDNGENLLMQFNITSSQLNGQEKSLAFGKNVTTDFGTLPAQGHTYAQWWMTSDIIGHFKDYDISCTHLTLSDNPNLSLVSDVKIHELIRSIVVEGSENTDYAFAVNETADAQNQPDKLYLVDGTTAPINAAQAKTEAIDDDSHTLAVEVSDDGWTYAVTADPTDGNAVLVEVVREDGTTVPLRNVWQTWATLTDRTSPTHENLIHIIDNCKAGTNAYTLRFEQKPEATIGIVSVKVNGAETGSDVSVSNAEVQSVEVEFTQEVLEVKPRALSLVNQGETVDLMNASWSVSGNILTIDLSQVEHNDGFYCLTVNTAYVSDISGNTGRESKAISWIEQTNKPVRLNLASNYPEAATVMVLAEEYQNEKIVYDTPQTPAESYRYGTTLTLKVVPNYGFVFNRWSLDGNILSTEDTYEYNLTAAKELKMYFDRQSFNISVSNIVDDSVIGGEGGALTLGGTIIGGGTGVYEYGEEVTLTAVPEECHKFVGWYTDAPSSAAKAFGTVRTTAMEGYQLLSTETTYTYTVTGETKLYPVFHRLGDVNGDNMFTIADLVCLTNHINGNTPATFVQEEADANNDGQITVDDVTMIAATPLMTTATVYDGTALTVPDIKVAPGSTTEVTVYFELGGQDYTAYQFDVAYPEGITSVSDGSGNPAFTASEVYGEGQQLSAYVNAKGTDRFQCFSPTTAALKAKSGILLTLPVKVKSGMANGVYQATISPVEFVKTDATAFRPSPVTFNITVHDVVTNNTALAEGWNWVSTNIPTTAAPFVEDIKTNVKRLVGQTEELYNDEQLGMVGKLNSIDASVGYKLQATSAVTLTQQGIPEHPSLTAIELSKGYNWIGYVPETAVSVATALSNLQAATGDRLISQNGFAVYGDEGWTGDLTEMAPGMGYIYYRTGEPTTFCYTDNATTIESKSLVLADDEQRPWDCDIHKYPDVATVIAKLSLPAETIGQKKYKVGAFCGEECRGIGNLIGDNIFITIHGTTKDKETIVFRAYDEMTGETIPVTESIMFQGQSLGSLAEPMGLHTVSSVTGIDGVYGQSGIRAIHSTAGKRLSRMQRGVNIVTKTDGTAVKVVAE